MTAIQKQHTFNLVVIGVTFALFLTAIPFIGVNHAGGILGLMGFLGFGLFFIWQRKSVIVDERDRTILQRAGNVAFAIFWLAFVGGCVGVWYFYGDNGSIPIRILPIIMYGFWGLWQTAQSIAILVQYRTI